MNREYGVPKTTEERMATHYQQYGTTDLPPRGTGLGRGLTSAEQGALLLVAGILLGVTVTYIWMEPKKFRAKIREFK